MPPAVRHGGPIDPFTENSLYDFIGEDADLTPGEDHFEFYGIHLTPQGGTRFIAQIDGHAGAVEDFNAEDYDDVLELIDDLMDIYTLRQEYDWQAKGEDYPSRELVEWAGRVMTSDPNKDPDLYLHIPEDL